MAKLLIIAAILVAPAATRAQAPIDQALGSVAGATTSSSLEGATRPVSPRYRPSPEVRLKAGTQARVERGTRCYFDDRDDGYLEPVERDGFWYCEQGGGAAVVQAPR